MAATSSESYHTGSLNRWPGGQRRTRLIMIEAMANLNPGDPMPDVSLVGPDGPTKLREHIGKPLVVYFYPKDETYGCTKEACSFRDQYEDFVAAGAEVIGISRDDAASHAKFREHHRLPFTLLSDPGGSVAAGWGVRSLLGIPGRVTFV